MSASMVCSATTTSNVFETGRYSTREKKCSAPPSGSGTVETSTPLLIESPDEAGEFPLLIFLHGFFMENSFYSQLIKHIASHGFIVIAPQFESTILTDATKDIEVTADITNWISKGGLQPLLPPNTHPILTKVALAGHSRGGKIAFALALGRTPNSNTALKFSAIIGIDPVDGTKEDSPTHPPVLTKKPFDLKAAKMIIGSGYGELSNGLLPPTAPKGVNHLAFFKECNPPVCYFVAKDFGHLDVFDDQTGWFMECVGSLGCKNGEKREPMRRFVGGIVVAFLNAYLKENEEDLMDVKTRVDSLPVKLDTFEFRME